MLYPPTNSSILVFSTFDTPPPPTLCTSLKLSYHSISRMNLFLSDNRCFLSKYLQLALATIPAVYFSNESMRVFAAASDGRGA